MQAQKDNNMTERRNFYRILNVQPDAPIEVIRNNYRTLLQKLRLHPDLGGEDQSASLINEAYAILTDPDKRAKYDSILLNRYNVKSLSRGNLSPPEKSNSSQTSKDQYGNQRNYYRLMNIQPDSSEYIIKTTFHTLKKSSNIPEELLNEAYSVLGNQEKRKLYDKLIKQYEHPDAVKLLQTGSTQLAPQKTKVSANQSKLNNLYGTNKKSSANLNNYQPVITQFCHFCKTPHDQSPCRDTAPLCNECQSPLFPPEQAFLQQNRRDIIRTDQDHMIQFYTYWPGKIHKGMVVDMSPTGLQLITSNELSNEQILKLDADGFKAVGEVTYQNTYDKDLLSTGIKFLTINFTKQKGQFFSASA
ncbi:MAG: DnaJ domain-containing protein [Gammaproteobacteria bacterium]|jgi:curved DNA-binding protein CbpA